MSHMKDLDIDRRNEIQLEDEVVVEFTMRINTMTRGGEKTGQIFGFTKSGMYVSAPISAIVKRMNAHG